MSLQEGHTRTLTRDQFHDVFEMSQDFLSGVECEESLFRDDITKVACLMLEEGVGDTTYLHKSIAEYHAAAFIKSCDDDFASLFYNEAAKDWGVWRECLNFLQKIDEYRFAKYFAIKNIEGALKEIERMVDCKTGKELMQAVPKYMKGLGVYFVKQEQNHSDGYNCAFFGGGKASNNYYLENLNSNLAEAAFNCAPKSFTEAEAELLLLENNFVKKLDEREICVPLGVAADLWGIENYCSQVEIFYRDLESQLVTAKVLAEKLANRTKIFEKKKRRPK